MHPQRNFIPGSRSNTSRIINYIAEYNAVNYSDKSIQPTCYCVPDKVDKNTPGTQSFSIKASYPARISEIIKYSKGGKTQYGNFYLGQPLNINYLGRIEGMPGGSGMPPLNRF